MTSGLKDWGVFRIHTGDCIESMRGMEAGSAQTCVTSPPYFGLRDYGCTGQIGLEKTPDEFVAALVAVFREVRRVLREDGTLWLNLGDSYAANRAYQVPSTKVGPKTGAAQAVGGAGSAVPPGLKPKDLIGIPWRVAFALQADGWYLRQDIIWHKPNPMPESVRDRCTKAHEYVFLLSKSERYYFDAAAMQEPAVGALAGNTKPTKAGRAYEGGATEHRTAAGPPICADRQRRKRDSLNETHVPGATAHGGIHREGTEREPETRNRRSVWTVATRPFKDAHFATFPPDLIRPCVLAGAPAGGVVLDPFGGAGTTGLVAAQEGRVGVLCELNPEYVDMAERRIAKALFGVLA